MASKILNKLQFLLSIGEFKDDALYEEIKECLEVLEILKPNLSADLFNKEDETGIIHLGQINIDKNSSQKEKDNFYKVRDFLRK